MKKHVVFVDDEVHILSGFRRMLSCESDAWDMVFLDSADKVLQETKQTEVDAIVSDVRMPVMDGFELLRQLKASERTRDIPVIIVTGSHEEDLKRRALDLGAADLLSKPVNTGDLIARVRSALLLKSHQDALKNQNEILEMRVKERTAELELLAAKLEQSRLEIIWRLGKAGEYRDEETGNHVIRMGCYCRPIAEALGLGGDFAEMIVLAAPLHDIGKIGIPDSILLKRGKLTAREWVVMKTHPVIGAAILRHDSQMTGAFARVRLKQSFLPAIDEHPVLSMASTIALNHHEKYDGTGYPNGLAGEAIPIEARIVAIADVFDALISDRCYRAALPEEEVLRMMQDSVGRHIDPVVHHAFLKCLDEIRFIRNGLCDSRAASDLHVENFELLDFIELYGSSDMVNSKENING